MKTIKNLDVQDIQQQIDSTKQFISQTKSRVEQIKQAISGITSLHDGFEGKTADSIRAFFEEAHQPFLEFMESFLVQYEEALGSVSMKVLDFESNEKGFIRQEYLEGELSNTMEKARDSLSSTTDAINQQLHSVSDIAAVADVSDQVFLDAISDAKERINRTVDNMYEMDTSAAGKLDKPEEDIQQIKAYLVKLKDAIDGNNITVDHFSITQFKGDFFSYHNEFKLQAKGRNALTTGEKAAITDEDFNELYPLIKDTEYVSDGEYEWHGTYYTLTDGRIVREYKHDTGVSYEFVDKIPDPRKAPPSGFDKVAKWGWDFLTEDIVTIFDPDASTGEKASAIAMFLPVGKPVKAINKFGGGFISDGVKSLEKIIDNQSSVKKATKDGKLNGIEQNYDSDKIKTPKKIKEDSNIKFSEMTVEEQMIIGRKYSHRAPIKIPENTKIKAQSKNGYEQLTYKWKDESYKYEVRWHTKTPGAPKDQGNTWVVQRTLPGNAGNKPQSFFKIGEDKWIEGAKWYDAIAARRSGNATSEQLNILEKGHWKD